MLRPIEGPFREVIAEVASSTKIRVTMENSKEMMQELNFYVIDVAELGSDTEDDGDDDAAEKEFNRLLMSSGIDEDEEAGEANVLDNLMAEMGETNMEAERRKIYQEENTIEKY